MLSSAEGKYRLLNDIFFTNLIAEMSKEVLVEYNERRKEVTFDAAAYGDLKESIKKCFGIQLTDTQQLIVQRRNEKWGGHWVDIEEQEEVPDESFLKVLVSSKVRNIMSILF